MSGEGPRFDGEKLRRLRKSSGLSLGEVAHHVGCSAAHVSRLETNKPVNFSFGMMSKLAQLFGVTLDEIQLNGTTAHFTTVDLIKEIRKADYFIIDGKQVESDDQLKTQLEAAIKKEFLWNQHIRRGEETDN